MPVPSVGRRTVTTTTTHDSINLREGSNGSKVRQLQTLLERAGYELGNIDGDFGSKTEQAVRKFQRAQGLSVDGVVGPRTWQALERAASGRTNPAPATPARPSAPQVNQVNGGTASQSLRQRIVATAQAEVGRLETGNNGGAAVKYQSYFGRGREKWCADFTSWVYTTSGRRMNDPYTPSIVADLKSEGRWKGKRNPLPGDLVLFDFSGDGKADHIGIVKKVNANGTIETIEGNTSNPVTGREGVWNRTRTMGSILGFGNP